MQQNIAVLCDRQAEIISLFYLSCQFNSLDIPIHFYQKKSLIHHAKKYGVVSGTLIMVTTTENTNYRSYVHSSSKDLTYFYVLII